MAMNQDDMIAQISQVIMTEEIDRGDAAEDMRAAQAEYDNADRPEPKDESEVLSIINSEMQNASSGTWATKVDQDRELALSYYLGNPRGDEQQDRSQVVSTDVADAIEWILPQVMKALTAKGSVISFDAMSEMDEDQAELETEFTHDVFMKQNTGFLNLYEFVKDALLMKNGVFKIYYDDTPLVKTERYTGITEPELQNLLTDPEVEPVVVEEYPDESRRQEFEQAQQRFQQQVQQTEQQIAQQAQGQAQQMASQGDAQMREYEAQIAQMPKKDRKDARGRLPTLQDDIKQQQGQQVQQMQQQAEQQMAQLQEQAPQMPVLIDIQIARTLEHGRVRVETVTPEEFRVNQYHNSLDLKDARFCAHSTLKTVSELVEEGYDPEIIKNHMNTVDDYYRREYRFAEQDETNYSQYGYSEDDSQSLLEISECYMHIDLDGDDVAELMKITVIGSETVTEILDMEAIEEIPFVSSSAIIMPHKYIGLSIYDRLKTLQDQKTSLWRNILDNLYLQNNREKEVVEGQVNMDDMLVSRPGGVKRVKAPGMIRELQVQPIGQEGYQMMDYLDRVRTGRVGVSPDTGAQDMAVGGDTAHGVERLMTAKEELTGLMVRTIAETGLKPAYVLIRDLLIRHQDNCTTYKFKGRWQDVDPSQWGPRSRISVTVGTGAGDDMRKQATLQQIIAYQKDLAQVPGQTLVDMQQGYNALDDLAKHADLHTASRYFLDPATPEGQAKKQEVEQKAQEAQMQQQQMQQAMAEAQQKISDAEMMKGQAALESQKAKLQIEGMKLNVEGQTNAMEAQMESQKLQMEGQKIQMSQMEMQIDAINAKSKMDNERFKTELKAVLDGSKQRFEYEKLKQEEALKITAMEVQNQQELSRQYLENKKIETTKEMAEEGEERGENETE